MNWLRKCVGYFYKVFNPIKYEYKRVYFYSEAHGLTTLDEVHDKYNYMCRYGYITQDEFEKARSNHRKLENLAIVLSEQKQLDTSTFKLIDLNQLIIDFNNQLRSPIIDKSTRNKIELIYLCAGDKIDLELVNIHLRMSLTSLYRLLTRHVKER